MLVDVATVAQALELSPRRVQQLVRQGWLPRESEGEYALADCLTAYAAYLEEVEGRRGVGGAIDRARARKIKAQAELREIELAVAAGDLVELEAVRERRGRALSTLRSRLLNLPSLSGRLVPAAPDECEALLRAEVEEALGALS